MRGRRMSTTIVIRGATRLLTLGQHDVADVGVTALAVGAPTLIVETHANVLPLRRRAHGLEEILRRDLLGRLSAPWRLRRGRRLA